MNRLTWNRLLVKRLGKLVERYPDMRFSQLLSAFEFVKGNLKQSDDYGTILDGWLDEFMVEPSELLERVDAKIREVQNDFEVF